MLWSCFSYDKHCNTVIVFKLFVVRSHCTRSPNCHSLQVVCCQKSLYTFNELPQSSSCLLSLYTFIELPYSSSCVLSKVSVHFHRTAIVFKLFVVRSHCTLSSNYHILQVVCCQKSLYTFIELP